jgi:hypothetical protein
LDTSLFKTVSVIERVSLNHPNLGTPNAQLGVPQFGTVTSQSIPPRQVQFALKLMF